MSRASPPGALVGGRPSDTPLETVAHWQRWRSNLRKMPSGLGKLAGLARRFVSPKLGTLRWRDEDQTDVRS